VFLTRQVFVKVELAGTMLLSEIVTSVTKTALLVQSGGLVGMGVSGVGVWLGCSNGGSMAVGASVVAAAWVCVGGAVAVAVSAGVGVLHAEINNIKKRQITSNILFIKNLLSISKRRRETISLYT
jgi:hypothetical protein